jgi:hypothetical protein
MPTVHVRVLVRVRVRVRVGDKDTGKMSLAVAYTSRCMHRCLLVVYGTFCTWYAQYVDKSASARKYLRALSTRGRATLD